MENRKVFVSTQRSAIPEADLARAKASVDAVEAALAPLIRSIPLETEPAFVVFCSPEESA